MFDVPKYSLLIALIWLATGGIVPAASILGPEEHILENMIEGEQPEFRIPVRNEGNRDVRILSVESTCVYIDASLEGGPGTIEPGEIRWIILRVDARNNLGSLRKVIEIRTDFAPAPIEIVVRAKILHRPFDRAHDTPLKDGCRQCHASSTVEGKSGEMLYNSFCYACHKNPSALRAIGEGPLRETISEGRRGTVMPGYLIRSGGPLTEHQVDSLIQYLRPGSPP